MSTRTTEKPNVSLNAWQLAALEALIEQHLGERHLMGQIEPDSLRALLYKLQETEVR